MRLLFALAPLCLAVPFLSPHASVDSTRSDALRTGVEPGTYSIDGRHSSVFFRTKHVGVSFFYGRFNHIEGELEYDPDSPEDSSIYVELETASVDTNDANRDKHLRSSDFFSAKEFPTIRFESTSVSPTDEGLEVKGKLEFHGETREVSCVVQETGSGDAMGAFRVGFETVLRIDMGDFGLSFVDQNPGALGPEVDLHISLECTRN